MRGKIDFTQGRLVPSLLLFALPIILGEMFQSLYNSVDSMVVGNLVGKTALAAVSVCSPLSSFFVGFSVGMSIGATVITSKAFGRKEVERLQVTVDTACSFALFLGLILSVAGVLTASWLLQLVSVPEDVYPEALAYLRIYMGGLCFTIQYNIVTGILRSTGDSRTPLLILLFSAVINLALDMVFVYALRWNVRGAAIATVLSQLISCALAYGALKRAFPRFAMDGKKLIQNRAIAREMMRIGMPSGIQYSLTYLSNIFVWRYIARFGASVMAGVGVAQKINKLVDYPCKGFGSAITTMISQNVGAGDEKRVKTGIRSGMLVSCGIILGLSGAVYLLAAPLSRIFGDAADVIEISVKMLHVITPFYVFMVIREVFVGILRGHGISFPVMVLGLAGMVGVRQAFLAVSMAMNPTPMNIYACYPIAWFATALLMYICYLVRKNGFPGTAEKRE